MGARSFIAAAALGLLAACGAASQGTLRPPGEALYVDRCGRCHEAYPAHAYADGQWAGVMRRMAPEAGLDEPEAGAILAWLVENN
ncbi:MAG: hypothetical protein FJ087_02145 [Deltaproteobacteria bacterium]|nr:hypothetical protein [Deltaproteobacteria bacterium]